MFNLIAVSFPVCFIIDVFELLPMKAISHCGFDVSVRDPVIAYTPSGK